MRRLIILGVVVSLSPLGLSAQGRKVDSVPSADGVAIRYQVSGSGEPALVFVHGWACNRTYWRMQLPHFAERHTVVALDLAGHGESGLNRDEWSMEAFGEDVAAVVNDLCLKRVILIGHSMGGYVIPEAARRLKGQTLGLIGFETFHNVERTSGDEDLAKFLVPFRSDFKKATESYVRGMFIPDSDPDLVERIVAEMSATPSKVGIGAIEGIANSYPACDVLDHIDLPIFSINADGWSPTNMEAAKRAGIDIVMLSGASHFAQLEEPERFNEVLSQVIEKVTRIGQ